MGLFERIFWRALLSLLVAYVLAMLFWTPVPARDLGQWANQDHAISEWYEHLMRPDYPSSSCCGEADAYWCDDISVKDGHTFCKITDDRNDEPLRRPHIAVGTVIAIPDEKLKWDNGNPTGHAIVFIATFWSSRDQSVLCFVQGTGI